MSILRVVLEGFRPTTTDSIADAGDTVASALREHLATYEGI
jgi:hypothetical protein